MSTLEFTRPRVAAFPEAFSGEPGQAAIGVAASAGLALDGWQEFVLENALGLREDGKWAAFEVGVNVPRQNGKGSILEARALAGLFVFGERYIIWSAHNFDTAQESFARLEDLIHETPELDRQVKKRNARTIGYVHSHGSEGIELENGARIRFRTRTKGGGKGFTADCVIFDEAMFLHESFHWALLPTLSARSIEGNPQVWYTGSAADEFVHENAVVWSRVRERGHAGGDESLAYFEWSAQSDDLSGPDDVTREMAADEELQAEANPALGIRISAEHIEKERRSLDHRGFVVERLGVGQWPRTDGLQSSVIEWEDWLALTDGSSRLQDPVCLAYDVAPDRSMAAIAAAGVNQDGHYHVEIIEHKRGTAWVAERFRAMLEKHDPVWTGCDGYAMLPELEDERLVSVTATQHGMACGKFVDAVKQQTFRHLGSDELKAAVRGARTRPIGDAAWAWSRKGSPVDITPLVAATLALAAAIDSAGGTDWTVYY